MEYIYLDHAATTPTHPEVANAMLPYYTSVFGNPSSVHHFGRETRRILDESRLAVAGSIHAKENEIIFTSGGTESDNLAIIGAAKANKKRGNHIITSQIEHHAVLHACKYLEKEGFNVTYLPVSENGTVSIKNLEEALTEETILVSIMVGNNEVGSIQPIKQIGELLSGRDILFHCDAVQAYGMLKLDVNELQVDMLSVSSHKINGPKGVGFLYVREGTKLAPLLYGGEQERKRRAGTENVPGIVGFHKAVEITSQTMAENREKYERYKAILVDELKSSSIAFRINGEGANLLPHVLNISFAGTNVESLLVNLDLAGISVSSGSACTAGSIEPSHVLVAMHGKSAPEVLTSIRFSFGFGNTEDQIKRAAQETVKAVKRLVK